VNPGKEAQQRRVLEERISGRRRSMKAQCGMSKAELMRHSCHKWAPDSKKELTSDRGEVKSQRRPKDSKRELNRGSV